MKRMILSLIAILSIYNTNLFAIKIGVLQSARNMAHVVFRGKLPKLNMANIATRRKLAPMLIGTITNTAAFVALHQAAKAKAPVKHSDTAAGSLMRFPN